MLILLKNNAVISGLDKEQLALIREHLTINNPLFFKRLDLGLSNWGTPQSLQYYENMGSTSIGIPIGALAATIDILKSTGMIIEKNDIIDNRVSNIQQEFFSELKFKGILRDYQEGIVQSCMNKTIGIVEAMTGSGKTICFVALTVKRREPTLILVNTIELANQTIDSFLKFTNLKREDIGFIGDGKFELQPVTVGLHQTMAKLPTKTFAVIDERIGQVIADECHIVAATSYFRTMTNLSAKYKFGFSATPKRDDGLTQVLHFASGPLIHKVPKDKLTGILITPVLRRIKTNYSFPLISSQEYGEMVSDLSIDKERNDLIVKTLVDDYKDKHICLLCTRLSQVEYLQEKLGDGAVSLTSKMNKKQRLKTMTQLKAGDKKIVAVLNAIKSS